MIAANVCADLYGVIAVHDSNVVHPLKDTFDIKIGGSTAKAREGRLAADLARGTERHGGKPLNWSGKEAEPHLLPESGAVAAIADGASVRARKSEPEFIDYRWTEDMGVVHNSVAGVLQLRVTAAERAWKYAGIRWDRVV